MKIKTSELIGAALDYAVAKCEGVPVDDPGYYWGISGPSLQYSKDWSLAGPIIERDRIHVYSGPQWTAVMKPGHFIYGLTPLVAAMRCYVAAKLGDTVDIPDELL